MCYYNLTETKHEQQEIKKMNNLQINNNGTSYKNALGDVVSAIKAVEAAIESVSNLGQLIHGRNYQTVANSHEAYTKDRAELEAMCAKLKEVDEYLESGALHIYKQRPK